MEFGSADLDLKIGCGAYIDDATLVGHVDVVAKGFKVFKGECARRGWQVNVTKTVLGVDLARHRPRAPAERQQRAAHIERVFPPGMAITYEGLVFLGTPVGTERGEWEARAPVPLGGRDYREAKTLEFINDHDKRLRNVVKLARRDTRSHDHTAHVSVQLAQLLLRWSCNARDVHLLRGLGRRVVDVAAHRHDQSIKVACAAIQGLITVPPTGHLYDVRDEDLPLDYHVAYRQITLAFHDGGHGLRPWAQHADAAFVGQWALSVQSAWNKAEGRSFYPILTQVLTEAAKDDAAPVLRISRDLRSAWKNSLGTANALAAGLVKHNCTGWITLTEGDVTKLSLMPEKAQRTVSQSVLAMQKAQFESNVGRMPCGGGVTREANWRAECESEAAAAWQAIPWDEAGYQRITNSKYRTSFARRYRLPRPASAEAPLVCNCGNRSGARAHGHTAASASAPVDRSGDHDEGECSKQQGRRSFTHDSIVQLLFTYLKACGYREVRTEPRDWDRRSQDRRPRGRKGTMRPDITCTNPQGTQKYVIDVSIAWNISTSGTHGYTGGSLAKAAEARKRSEWAGATHGPFAHPDFVEDGAIFIPFTLEISGGWGPVARRFFKEGLEWAGNTRDVDLYHWSSASFELFWRRAFGCTMINERGKVGLAAARGDWPAKVLRMNYVETEAAGLG